jgi:pimeloyl-ACP methyl ester carboxylesterase
MRLDRIQFLTSFSPFAVGQLGLLVLLLSFAGCSTPIGTNPADHRRQYRQAQISALSHNDYSDTTRLVLRSYELDAAFAHTPRRVLTELHARALTDGRRDLLFALAELSVLQGERLQRRAETDAKATARDSFLMGAIYAYYFLFGDGPEPGVSPFDAHFRLACDFYNYGLAKGLMDSNPGAGGLTLTNTTRQLPVGAMDFKFCGEQLPVTPDAIAAAIPADLLQVRGLPFHHRSSGIGAPLVVVTRTNAQPACPPQFPATALLRLPGSLRVWQAGPLQAKLELHLTFDPVQVELAGQSVPLKSDASAVLAYAFNNEEVWRLGRAQFFSAQERVKSGLYPIQPYQPGRVPVIFVHGTFHSPVHWARTWHALRADPALRGRFQFWCFVYNSGKPISDSAARLRDAIETRLHELDPERRDPALQHVVVIGHSQGGLLTKLTVTDTGETLWRTVSEQPLGELDCPPEVRAVLQRNFIYHRLPSVARVVFISTPHRGSYRATSFVQRVARRLVAVPQNLIAAPGGWLQLREQLQLPAEVNVAVPTSIDGMTPNNPWLLALAELPPAAGVKAHSIIAVKPGQSVPTGNDGVVTYESAHVPYVASEYVARGPHSCQGQSDVIAELRRILLQHLAEMPAAQSIEPLADFVPPSNH